jgi:LacI family transcriptional regulator
VCNCDVVAAGAALGAAERGLIVGRDLSIVGFDDIEDARLWVPPLTTVAVDPRGLGQQLAEAFLARKTAPERPVKAVNLPVRLKIRASSGPPASGPTEKGAA